MDIQLCVDMFWVGATEDIHIGRRWDVVIYMYYMSPYLLDSSFRNLCMHA